MKCFTPSETAKFLAAAKESKWYCVFLLAIETGMRPEEYLGLQWKDIDFDNKELSVTRAVVIRSAGGFVFTEPKTPKSRRRITLSDSSVAALKVHRRKQLEAKMKLGSDYNDLDLVFATELGTPLDHRNLRNRHFKPMCEQAKLPAIRLYDLQTHYGYFASVGGHQPEDRFGTIGTCVDCSDARHLFSCLANDAARRNRPDRKTDVWHII